MKNLLVMLGAVMLLTLSGCCCFRGPCVPSMKKNAVLLDVRNPNEYQKGFLKGAVNLPQAEVDAKAAKVVPSKDTPVYVYCRGGREATMATEKLQKLGYTDVHNLGAMKDAQKRLGLPTVK